LLRRIKQLIQDSPEKRVQKPFKRAFGPPLTIEGASANSARRSLAVKLHRKGYDLVHIAKLLGHKSVSTTKRLVTQDPVRLADIVARAI
jgi:site-specific recombinase XerD